MAKTILFPTDFSIASLKMVKHGLDRNRNIPLNIVFVAGISLSDNITELLFFSKKKIVRELSSEEFNEACQIIRNRYPSQIHSMRVDIFTGFTQAAFRNYLEGNKIDEIYIPTHPLALEEGMFDMIPYMKKASHPSQTIEWQHEAVRSLDGGIAQLFTNWN